MIHNNRPFLLIAFFVASTVLLPSSSSAQGAADSDASFRNFLAEFQTAIAHHDRAGLQAMMTPSFDFFQAQHVPHSTVFSHLVAEGGKQWMNVQTAVQGPRTVAVQYKNRPARLMQCTPTQDIYRCLLVFQQDNKMHWRWKAMVMPHRY